MFAEKNLDKEEFRHILTILWLTTLRRFESLSVDVGDWWTGLVENGLIESSVFFTFESFWSFTRITQKQGMRVHAEWLETVACAAKCSGVFTFIVIWFFIWSYSGITMFFFWFGSMKLRKAWT
jgi:hypothetical protein